MLLRVRRHVGVLGGAGGVGWEVLLRGWEGHRGRWGTLEASVLAHGFWTRTVAIDANGACDGSVEGTRCLLGGGRIIRFDDEGEEEHALRCRVFDDAVFE